MSIIKKNVYIAQVKGNAMAITNKRLPQELDALVIYVIGERYDSAKEKINIMRQALDELDKEIDILAKG